MISLNLLKNLNLENNPPAEKIISVSNGLFSGLTSRVKPSQQEHAE